MVTALGIDVRKAFTLVFAIGGVAAALAGVLAGVYFGADRPAAGHVAADLRLHRRRDRRPRLDHRLGGRRRRRRAGAAVRELLRLVAASATSRSCCCSRSSCSCGPRGPAAGRRWRIEARPLGDRRRRSRSSRCSRSSRSSRSTRHGVFSSAAQQPGHAAAARLCLVFGGVALTYDLLFGFTGLLSFGHALYFAVGVYMTAIATDGVGLEPAGRRSLFAAVVGVVRAARARLGQPAGRRDRVRDGDARVRAGGLDPRRRRTRDRLDRR